MRIDYNWFSLKRTRNRPHSHLALHSLTIGENIYIRVHWHLYLNKSNIHHMRNGSSVQQTRCQRPIRGFNTDIWLCSSNCQAIIIDTFEHHVLRCDMIIGERINNIVVISDKETSCAKLPTVIAVNFVADAGMEFKSAGLLHVSGHLAELAIGEFDPEFDRDS